MQKHYIWRKILFVQPKSDSRKEEREINEEYRKKDRMKKRQKDKMKVSKKYWINVSKKECIIVCKKDRMKISKKDNENKWRGQNKK